MEEKKVLLVGESWVTSANHTKGWDTFSSVTFHLGAEPLVDALKDSPFELTYMKAHEAALDFPLSLEGLTYYDAILLSDIGSNTLLLHPDVWLRERRSRPPQALKEYSARRRAHDDRRLLLVQGIDGRARWHKKTVEEVLPVACIPFDDRFEALKALSPRYQCRLIPSCWGSTHHGPPCLG